MSSDSEINYMENGNKSLGFDDVDYRLNNYGYRSDEFDQTGCAAAFMFVGCSFTLGVGVPWDAVWTTLVTRHFETTWGIRVRQYNLGWGGTSSDYIAMMVHQCVDVLRPIAVFVLWPDYSRIAWFSDRSARYDFRPLYDTTRGDSIVGRFKEEHQAYLRLATDAHGFYNFVRNYNFVAMKLAIVGIPWFCGVKGSLAAVLDNDQLLEQYVPIQPFVGAWEHLDYARDNRHSGVESHADFAGRVIEFAEKEFANAGA